MWKSNASVVWTSIGCACCLVGANACTLDAEGTAGGLFAPSSDAGSDVITDTAGGRDQTVDGTQVEDAPFDSLPEAAPAQDVVTHDADTGTPDAEAGCLDTDGDGVCDTQDVCPGADDGVDADGDGVPDGCDPCPGDNPDDQDGDGVCDSEDVCTGSDDAVDADGDGVPDGCDPCPIDGPAAPGIELPVSGSGITISSASINGGGNVAVVNPGQTFSVTLAYSVVDCGCSGCLDEIEVGFVPGGGPSYCAYQGVPGCQGASGTDTSQMTAPSGPGVYDIRFNLRQDYVCGTSWWGPEPGDVRTVASICVP